MDAAPRNIVLVGFMGTGKTSVGKRLAQRLGMRFVDMDDVIEARAGKPIPEIFALEGEPHFRRLEHELARELSERSGLVISTGGGIVLNPENIKHFARTGLVVCLSATPEAILKRVSANSNRPLLEGGDKMKKIRSLLESRKHLYDAIPFQVDTTPLRTDEVVDVIARQYAGG